MTSSLLLLCYFCHFLYTIQLIKHGGKPPAFTPHSRSFQPRCRLFICECAGHLELQECRQTHCQGPLGLCLRADKTLECKHWPFVRMDVVPAQRSFAGGTASPVPRVWGTDLPPLGMETCRLLPSPPFARGGMSSSRGQSAFPSSCPGLATEGPQSTPGDDPGLHSLGTGLLWSARPRSPLTPVSNSIPTTHSQKCGFFCI